MKLIPGGVQITFTKRLAKSTHVPDQFKFKRYYYEYRQGYGSPQNGTEAIKVAGSKRLGDEKTMMVYLDKMNPGYIYQLDLKGVEAEDGSAVVNPLICYTLNRLTNGDDKAPHLVRK